MCGCVGKLIATNGHMHHREEFIMTSFARMLSIWVLVISGLALADENNAPPAKSLISFYRADLVCPAATQIGCGSAAKPILLELERASAVREAWLNRSGTIVAIVWKESTAQNERGAIVQTALGTPKLREVKGNSREQILESFRSGTGWYRGATVDRLSEEEAGIIAARLVRRIGNLIAIPSDKADGLRGEFTKVMVRRLTQGEGREQTEKDLLQICQAHFDEKEVAILRDAREKGAFSHLREE